MKKILYLIILIISSTSINFDSIGVLEEQLPQNDNTLSNEDKKTSDELIKDGFIPISNFIELASIGRNGKETDFPSDGNFILMNDIELPHLSYRDTDVQTGLHGEDLQEFQKLIPDYFRKHFRNAADTAWASFEAFRGWKPIPNFSGIFDGRGFTISGLAGNRLSINSVDPGNGDEQNIGLFGEVIGGHILNLNVELGQKLEWRGQPAPNAANHPYATTLTWGRLISGVAHLTAYGNIGTIAGRLVSGAVIENSFATSLTQDTINRDGNIANTNDETVLLRSSLQSSRPAMGGLVGEMHDSTIKNSGSSVFLRGVRRNSPNCTNPTSGASARDGDTIGGFVGDARRSLIENSFSSGVIRHGNRRIGGFIAIVGDATIIRNSYSTTSIDRMASGNDNTNVEFAAGGFAHWVALGNRSRLENVFAAGHMATAVLARTRSDGFISNFPDRADFENVVVTNQTTEASVRLMTEEQIRTRFFVDNFLNDDKSIFHIEEEGQLPTINPNPQPLQKTKIRVSSASIQSVEGISMIGFITNEKPLRLTEGDFEIIFNHNNELIDFRLTVTNEDIQKGHIEIRRVEFRNYNDAPLGSLFFRDGDNINTFEPEGVDRVFAGWFSDINDGKKIDYVLGNDITVWARNHNVVIFGTTNSAAQIIVSAINLESGGNFDDLIISPIASGEFEILNLPRGIFLITIRVNGFVDYKREFTIDEDPIIELTDILLLELTITGNTLPNTVVVITNSIGQEIARTDTLSTGVFTFRQIHDGEYSLRLVSNGFVPRTISFEIIRENIDFNIHLDEYLILLDVVEISGTARENTVVWLLHNDNLLASVIVKSDETFVFSALHTDTPINNTVFEIVSFLETFDTQRQLITVTGNASVINLNFFQERLVTISGITSQRTRVSLFQGETLINTVQSDSFGIFEFVGVNNGVFRLVLERPNFDAIIEKVTINYQSVDLERLLLQRTPVENAHFGMIMQVILVSSILIGFRVTIYKKRKKV